MKKLTFDAHSYYEILIRPHFADVIPDGPYSGTLNEFTVMDNVSSTQKIVDILGSRNILKRRDASCNLIFSPVAKAKIRSVSTDKIYGATKNCENEFYQGCLTDFQNNDPIFRDNIVDFFLKAIKADLDSNTYFGDITRADDPNGYWNWNTFDGIFKKYAGYIADSTIPSSQIVTIGAGTFSGTDAFNLLSSMFAKQDLMLKSMSPEAKAFYVSNDVYYAYLAYLQNTGGGFNIGYYLNGIPKLSFNGIPVLLEPTWEPALTSLNSGTIARAAILTIRGNFVFATDKNYGEETDKGNKALLVWYSYDELTWKYVNFMKAGTGIAYPEHTVFAMTSIS